MFLSLMVSIIFVYLPLVFLFGANVAVIGAGVVSIILPIICGNEVTSLSIQLPNYTSVIGGEAEVLLMTGAKVAGISYD